MPVTLFSPRGLIFVCLFAFSELLKVLRTLKKINLFFPIRQIVNIVPSLSFYFLVLNSLALLIE